MKKFVLITTGYVEPADQIKQEWKQWFKSIEDLIIDQVSLGNGKEVTPENVIDLPMDKDAITGYMVINAKDMDEALSIAKSCPIVSSTKVYEMKSH